MPIMLLLILNTIMFTLTVKSVCLLDKQKRDLGLTSGQRSMEMERSVYFKFALNYERCLIFISIRFLLFVKLFVGMGIMWSFEIIAGLMDDMTNESVW